MRKYGHVLLMRSKPPDRNAGPGRFRGDRAVTTLCHGKVTVML